MKNINAAEEIINELVALGAGNIELMKFDKKWVFKNINSKEHSNILDNSSDSANDMVSRMFKMQRETLREALVSINDVILNEDEKATMLDNVNPYIVQTLYRLYDAERAKKEREIDSLK